MPSFDAGSIEATVHLNRDPFTEGLRIAQEQARLFESDDIHKTVIVSQTLHEDGGTFDETSVPGSQERTIHINTEADTAATDARLAALNAEIDHLDGRTIDIHTDVSRRNVDELGRSLDRAAGDSTNGQGGGGGMRGLILAALALAPALAPVVPLVGALAGGLASAFTTGIAGVSAFAIVAKSDFTQISTAGQQIIKDQATLANAFSTTAQKAAALQDINKVMSGMSFPMQTAVNSFTNMVHQFDLLKQRTSSGVLDTISKAFMVIDDILARLAPVINATATAFSAIFTKIDAGVKGQGFRNFLSFVATNIGPQLLALAHGFGVFGGAFIQLMEKLNPLAIAVANGFVKLADAFARWSSSLTSSGVASFMAGLGDMLGRFMTLLGSFWMLLRGISAGLAPLVSPAQDFLTVLLYGFSKLTPALAAVAKLIGSFFTAIEPLTPVIVDLINAAVVPLANALNSLVTSYLTPAIEAFSRFYRTHKTIVDAFASVAFAVWLLNVALNASPYVLLARAIFILGAVIYKYWDQIEAVTKRVWKNIVDFMRPVTEFIETRLIPAFVAIYGAVSGFLAPLVGAVENFAKNIVKHILDAKDTFSGFGEALGHVLKVVGVVVSFLTTALAPAIAAVSAAFEAGFKIIREVVVTAVHVISAVLGGIVDVVSDVIKFVIALINGDWKKAWDAFTAFFHDLGKTVLGALGALGSGILAVLGDLGSMLWSWIKSLGSLIAKIPGLLLDALKGLGLLLVAPFVLAFEGIKKALIDWLPALGKFFLELPGKILSFIGDAGGWLFQKGSDILSGLLHGLGFALGSVVKWFADLPANIIKAAESGKKFTEWLWDKGKDLLTGLVNGLIAKEKDVGDWFSKLPDKITAWVGDTKKWIKDKGSDVLTGFIDGILAKEKDISDWFTDLPDKILKWVGDTKKWIKDKGKDIVVGFFEGLDNAITMKDIGEFFRKLPSRILGFTKDYARTLFHVGSELIRGLAFGIGAGIGAMVYLFTQLPFKIAKWLDGAATWLIHTGEDIISGLLNGAIRGTLVLGDFFLRLPGRAILWTAGAGAWLFGVGENIMAGLLNGAIKGTVVVGGFFLRLPAKILSWVLDAGFWLIHIGEEIMSGILTGLINGLASIGKWLVELPGKFLDFLVGPGKSAALWLLQVGKDIVSGLLNGLNTVSSAIGHWISSIRDSLVGGFKSAFGIHSPSRVFHELGLNLMDGLFNGIDAGHENVIAQAHVLANNLTKAYKPKLSLDLTAHAMATQGPVTNSIISTQKQLAKAISLMRQDFSTLPKQIGEETGNAVANKLDPKLKKQTMDGHQLAVMRARQGTGEG